MKIRCKRPIITEEGITELEFVFDTDTHEMTFSDKDVDLLLVIYKKKCLEFPELTTYEIMD